jgi:hypothetical protein
MKIPPEAMIPEDKLTRYLLVPREQDDKSKFLAQAGFFLSNWPDLLAVIRLLAETGEAVEDGSNPFGDFYRIEGMVTGPNRQELAVVIIWLRWHVDGSFHFVTLKPWRKES